MRLRKQLRALNWGTPIEVVKDEEVLYEGSAKGALEDESVREYSEAFTKTVRMKQDRVTKELSPVLEIILKPTEV